MSYSKEEILEIIKEIDAINGVIDDKKIEELKLKYPGFRQLNMLINTHNNAVSKIKSKKKQFKNNFNNKKPIQKSNDKFKNKLNKINHIIDDKEKIKLNPDNNSHLDALIKLHNTSLIKEEQEKISKEFTSYLRKSIKIIDEKEIEQLKFKYTKDYCNFFNNLKMEKKINEHNKKLEKRQEMEVYSILRKEYSSLNSPMSEKSLSELILQYPNLDWNQIIKKQNKLYFKQLYDKTESNVYYINEYIRKDDWDYVDLKRSKVSKEILKYKDKIPKFIEKFTHEIIGFIEDFSNYWLDDNVEKIFLISVPSATPERNKDSSMKKSIRIIENKYKTGSVKFNTACKRQIIDFSNALVRTDDVKIAHVNKDDRPTYDDHKRTIKFNNDKNYNFENSVFIVLDDITTTGTIMNACGDILVENNIDEDKIYKLAIAATVWDYHE